MPKSLALHWTAGLCGVHIRSHQKSKLNFGVELLHIHVLGLIFAFHKEVANHLPHVQAFYPIVVQHVEQAVARNADFRQVRSGQINFIDSLNYGSTNRRRMAFMDLLCVSTSEQT